MFYTEEDIQPVVDVVTRELGQVGNMGSTRDVLPNVTVAVPQFGKVWYGDYEGSVTELSVRLNGLAAKTGYNFTFEVNQS
jgi:hypothetical protein